MRKVFLCCFLYAPIIVCPILSQAIVEHTEIEQKRGTILQSYQALFQEITDTISNHFYDAHFLRDTFPTLTETYQDRLTKVNTSEKFSALIESYLAEFHTSHTTYYSKEDEAYYHLAAIFGFLPIVQDIFKQKEVEYPSIGILTEKRSEKSIIAGVLNGSSAHEAGLKKGDVILGINDLAYSLSNLQKHLGKKVSLKIQRKDENLVFEVIPKLINPQEELLEASKQSIRLIQRGEQTIGYIHLWSFAGTKYYDLLKEAVLYDQLKDADALILDIRDGWGGANPEYLNLFNPNVPILTYSSRGEECFTFDSQWRKPVVLLVNDKVRSGKEILAYGFKKFKIGKVIGEQTAGAVTGGRVFFMQDQSMLYLAVNEVAVDGEILEGIGIRPDIPTLDNPDTAQDEILEKALEMLK